MEIKHYPSGNTALYIFNTSEAPKAVILLVHGLGEHAGRYEGWAARFNERGVALRAFDLPGHGNSEGRRGVIAFPAKVFDTIDKISEEIATEFPGVPLFLYGHSLGGGIVLNYLVSRRPRVQGAIVTSPWLMLTESPARFKMLVANVAKKLMPGMTQPSGLKTGYLSRDPGVVDAYQNDPLVHDMISAGLYGWVTDTAAETLSRASEITVPLLIAHGRNDMITSPSGSLQVAGAAPKATIKLWEGGYHELHNDLLKDEHFDFITEWIDTLI
ncbi:MAG: alpha/beta hydrolase [Bacteroidales bacterium]|nr:alpha/beta hydrolase [Bacteroidales bacterium]